MRTSYEENTLETLKKLEKTVLQPSQQKELSIMVRGKIKLEVSNYYFRNIKVTYIYNITEDRVELIEERRE